MEKLRIHLLGELQVVRDGERIELPASRKARALLAWLVLTNRSHTRESLCGLLWDVADDPRGALRWCLSRLRAALDGPGQPFVQADRSHVTVDLDGVWVDALELRQRASRGVEQQPTEALVRLAGTFRGELLEALDLPDFHDFQLWCAAERERVRGWQLEVLGALVDRLAEDPEAALPHARAHVRLDPLDEEARARLVRLLALTGRRPEAEAQIAAARRMYQQLGARPSGRLSEALQELRADPRPRAAAPADDGALMAPTDLVGRGPELGWLVSHLEGEAPRVVLLEGEPGAGKSRLLDALIQTARVRGLHVLQGASHDAERRPYGPWLEALEDLDTTALLAGDEASRERLFARIAEQVHLQDPLLLVLDDVHWCDEASAALLHHVVRSAGDQRLVVALAARDGELHDNGPILRCLAALRREGVLSERILGPLPEADLRALVQGTGADLDQVVRESGGNPLLALELARAAERPEHGVSLSGLVRDRLLALPDASREVLDWASVLGPRFSIDRLVSLLAMDVDDLLRALAALERHALLRAAGDDGAYAFGHEVVRRVVYDGLAGPRRRLMHRRVAEGLDEQADASEVAHHAVLGGDGKRAARACVEAGRRALRVFAHADALALARQGLRCAESVGEPERLRLQIELYAVRLAAERADHAPDLASRLEDLAERALDHGCADHARLGFQLLAQLRWDHGAFHDAHRDTLRALKATETGPDTQRATALAEAARCLVLVERDLPGAEAMTIEARAVCARTGEEEPVALPLASGMLRAYRGEWEQALEQLEHARVLAQRRQDRLAAFEALEQQVRVELSRERHDAAVQLALDAVKLADRLGEGSEAPFARALLALARIGAGSDERAALDEAIEALRVVDAKYRRAWVLNRSAVAALGLGDRVRASEQASTALQIATALERPTEVALATDTLARCQEEPDA